MIYQDDNQTTVPLVNNQSYTGSTVTIENEYVMISIETDTSCLLSIMFSPNKIHWYSTNYIVDSSFHRTFRCTDRYFKLQLLNDSGTDQTYLRLYTMFGNTNDEFSEQLNDLINVISPSPTATTLWDNESVSTGDTKTHLNKNGLDVVLNTSGLCTVLVQVSSNGIDYYDHSELIAHGSLSARIETKFKYVQFKVLDNTTLTLIVVN